MPVITMTLGVAQADNHQKKEFIEAVTDSAGKILNLPEQAFTVLINELDPANIGVAGTVLAERLANKG